MQLKQVHRDKVYHWSIDSYPLTDNKGRYVRVGSWTANHWFHVALGRTIKQTLSYAKKHLRALCPDSEFNYVDCEPTYFEQECFGD